MTEITALVKTAEVDITKGTTENKTMPWRNRAYTAIWQAVKDGKLKRGSCRICGSAKTQAHHKGGRYITKASIIWLCDKHHRELHVRLRKQHSTVKAEKSEKTTSFEMVKSDKSKRLVYLIVAKPEELDTDSQWFEAQDVEILAHRYLLRYTLGSAFIYEEHKTRLHSIFVVESYLAPVDFQIIDDSARERIIRKGTWIAVLWVPNDEIWTKIQNKELTGASPRGPAKLIPGQMP